MWENFGVVGKIGECTSDLVIYTYSSFTHILLSNWLAHSIYTSTISHIIMVWYTRSVINIAGMTINLYD